MVQKYTPPKGLSIYSPYKFVGAAGEGVCAPSDTVLSIEALRFRKEVVVGYRVTSGNRSIVTRTFKCITPTTGISEADGSVQFPRSHWPLAPHPSRVFITWMTEPPTLPSANWTTRNF